VTVSRLFSDPHRRLQDRFDSRTLADTLELTIVQPHLDEEAIAFIEARPFFFLSTVNAEGQPTVSHKGGAAGFVRVPEPTTLLFPSYDGNGMYLSMGNIATNPNIGLLFIDFERPHRVRVHATAELLDDEVLVSLFPGADLVVRATVSEAFVNCPRYITTYGESRPSRYLPDTAGEAPMPAWKRIDLLQGVLPERFQGRAEAEGGTISVEEYAERLAAGDG
jgi:predicted pyridoxine 5'-phosphate oxidase superfamily flavin-nucleotide-binding protein